MLLCVACARVPVKQCATRDVHLCRQKREHVKSIRSNARGARSTLWGQACIAECDVMETASE